MSKINQGIKYTNLASKSFKAVIGLSSGSECTTTSTLIVVGKRTSVDAFDKVPLLVDDILDGTHVLHLLHL